MEKSQYLKETEKVYNHIMQCFDDIDPDIAEATYQLDNITILFSNGTRYIINRQPPVSQIWLATKKHGLHFNFDAEKKQWFCDKNGDEFFNSLSDHMKNELNFEMEF